MESVKKGGYVLGAEILRAIKGEPLLSVAVFLGLLAYFPGLFYSGYVMDDTVAVQRNPLVVGSPTFWDYFRKDFWGLDLFAGTWTHKSFRPITTLTYRLNYLVHGLDSRGFHVTNILLHLGVSCLIGRVSRRVFRLSGFWAAAVAGLFAVHPVHTENVLYLVGRADILATLFAVLAVDKYFSTSSFGGALCCVCLSGLAKETGLMLLPVFVVMEIVRGCQTAVDWNRLGKWVVSTVCVLYMRHWHTSGTEINMSVQDNPVQFETDRLTRMLTYAFIHGKYFQLLVFPYELVYDYSLNAIPMLTSLNDLRLLLPLSVYSAVLLSVFFAVSRTSQQSQSLLFSLSLLIATFFPASNIIFPVGTVVGERLLYLPSLGAALFTGLVLSGTAVSWGKLGMSGLLVVGGIRTYVRALDWQSSERLFLSDGVRQPKSAKTQFNVGITHMQNQEWDKAEKALVECALADSMSALPYWRIGQIEILRGRFQQAADWLMEASTKFGATLMVRDEEIFHDLSVALWQVGKFERSEYYMNIALELNPNFPKALNNFGCLLVGKKDGVRAQEHILEAVRLSGGNHRLYLENLQFVADKLTGDHKVGKKAASKLKQIGGTPGGAHKAGGDCVWEFVPAS